MQCSYRKLWKWNIRELPVGNVTAAGCVEEIPETHDSVIEVINVHAKTRVYIEWRKIIASLL